MKIFNFTATPEFWADLKAAAARMELSASAIIRLAVREWLARNGRAA